MSYKNNPTTQQTTGQAAREFIGLLLIVFLIRTFGFGLYQVPSGSMETTLLVGERFFGDKLSMWVSTPQRGHIIAMNDPLYTYSSNPVVRLFQDYVYGPGNWTKRVIGLPGETVEGKIEDGKPVVYINGQKFDEPYLNKLPLLGVWLSNGKFTLRTYDPSKSYTQQPFYRINPDFIARVKPGMTDPSFTVTQDGRLLKLSDTPTARDRNQLVRRQGKSYWDGSDEFYIELGPKQYWLMGDNRGGSSDCRVFGPIERRLIHAIIRFIIFTSDSEEGWWIVDLIKHPIDFWQRMRWNRCLQVLR